MNSPCRAVLLTILPICAVARADIAYDNLSHDAFDGDIISQSEIAQQITLQPGPGRVLEGLSMRLRNGDVVSDSAGFLTMSVYTDAGDLPGSLLASETFPHRPSPSTPHPSATGRNSPIWSGLPGRSRKTEAAVPTQA